MQTEWEASLCSIATVEDDGVSQGEGYTLNILFKDCHCQRVCFPYQKSSRSKRNFSTSLLTDVSNSELYTRLRMMQLFLHHTQRQRQTPTDLAASFIQAAPSDLATSFLQTSPFVSTPSSSPRPPASPVEADGARPVEPLRHSSPSSCSNGNGCVAEDIEGELPSDGLTGYAKAAAGAAAGAVAGLACAAAGAVAGIASSAVHGGGGRGGHLPLGCNPQQEMWGLGPGGRLVPPPLSLLGRPESMPLPPNGHASFAFQMHAEVVAQRQQLQLHQPEQRQQKRLSFQGQVQGGQAGASADQDTVTKMSSSIDHGTGRHKRRNHRQVGVRGVVTPGRLAVLEESPQFKHLQQQGGQGEQSHGLKQMQQKSIQEGQEGQGQGQQQQGRLGPVLSAPLYGQDNIEDNASGNDNSRSTQVISKLPVGVLAVGQSAAGAGAGVEMLGTLSLLPVDMTGWALYDSVGEYRRMGRAYVEL